MLEPESIEDRIAGLLDNLEIKNQQYTDLMRAAVENDYEHLVALLRTVSPEVLFRKDLKGRTALDWARIQNNSRSISLISQAMTKALNSARKQRAGVVASVDKIARTSNRDLTLALTRAIDEKDGDKVMRILVHSHLSREVVDELEGEVYFADTTTKQGDTPLIRCAGLGLYDVVLELIDMGVDINAANQYGHSALTWACLCGHSDVVRALLSKGADIFHQTVEGRTGLHYACLYIKGRVVSVLFDVLFEQFSMFRVNTHPFTKYDPRRWTKYAEMMEQFVLTQDQDGFTAIDLIPTNPSEADAADAVFSLAESSVHHEVLREDTPHTPTPLVVDHDNDGGDGSGVGGDSDGGDGSGVGVARDLAEVLAAESTQIESQSLPSSSPSALISEDKHGGGNSDRDQSQRKALISAVQEAMDGGGGEDEEVGSVGVEGDDDRSEWSLGNSRQTQHTHSSAYFSAFLTQAYSLKTAESETAEVFAIYNILRVVNDRISSWHKSAEKETQMAAPVLCWNGCGHRTRFEEMTTHVRDSCTHKPTVCGDCSEVHPAYHMKKHLTQECCRRLVACPNTALGCRYMVQAYYMDTHVNLRCPYRLAFCRLHCGKRFPVIKRDDHEQNHCKQREIECHMCHQKIPSIDMSTHTKDLCPCRQVRCTIGCMEWFNVQDIERHETFECMQPCKWNCGESIGPLQKRVNHELTECLNRAVECRNACGIQGLTARNEADHVYNYCVNATMPCPNHCGVTDIRRADLHRHLDPWHGTCPDRYVRCPSDLVGWRILYNNKDEGIVIKYKREECLQVEDWEANCAFELPDRSDSTWCADGVDVISVRFADRHEWIPYWTSDIVPLCRQVKKIKGENSSDGEFPCGWLCYSELNEHLVHHCPNRVVLVGAANPRTEMTYSISVIDDEALLGDNGSLAGSVSTVETFSGTESLMSSLNAFEGQAVKVKAGVDIANARHTINEFLVAPPENVTCDYCSIEVEPDRLEWHIKNDCSHVLMRCKFGCGTKVPRRQAEHHMKHDCPKRNVHCAECNLEMWADEVEDHLRDSCPCRPAECPNECGESGLTAQSTEEHMRDHCVNRIHLCECGMSFPFYELSDHLITTCSSKPGLCPQGCGLIITRDKLDDHMEYNCPNKHVFQNKLVPCPLNCGQRLKRVDVLEHVSYKCQMRLTECPYRCGNTFRKEKLGEHMKVCPNRPLYCEKGMPTCQFKLHQWFWQEEEDDDEDSIMTEPDMFSHEEGDLSFLNSPSGRKQLKSAVSFADSKEAFGNTSGRLISQSNLAALALAAKKNKSKLLTESDGEDLASVDSATLSIAQSSTSVSYSDGKLAMKEMLRLHACPKHGRNLLMYAVRYDELSLAKYIIDKTQGEDLDLQDKFGDTAMTLACRMQKADFVELLIHYGADVNMETTGGKTPLIEATKVNDRKIVEMLITAGSVVSFKTKKHQKCASDWAQIMKNENLYIYLDIGSVVQRQMEEMFLAISRGDDEKVIALTQDGEFFTPNNSTRFQEAMERYVEMTKESKQIVSDYSTNLKALQEDCAAKKIVYHAENEKELAAEAEYEKAMGASKVIRVNIGARFEIYDKKIATIRVFDLEEIVNNRNPAWSTRVAVLAYALLFGALDTEKLDNYRTDMGGIRAWWPIVMKTLLSRTEAMKKLKTFSWISLQSEHLAELGKKIRSLYAEYLEAVAKEAEGSQQRGGELGSTSLRGGEEDGGDSVSGMSGSLVSRSHFSSGSTELMADPIPPEEWDSDDDNAGDGEWVKGQWVPRTRVKDRWWDRDNTESSVASTVTPVTGFKSRRNNVVNMSEKLKELQSENIQNAEGGVGSEEVEEGQDQDSQIYEKKQLDTNPNSTVLVLVDCMAVLMSAVTAMVNDLHTISENTNALRRAKSFYDEKKRISDTAKQQYDSVNSKCIMIENEMNSEVQKLLLYRRRIEQNKEKLRITRLLNSMSPCGHTIISWAAATGSYAVIEHLLSHGATVGYPEDMVHMSAGIIQATFRLFYYHSSYAKRRKIEKQQAAAEAINRGDAVSREGLTRKASVMEAVPVLSAAAAMNAEEGAVHVKSQHGVEEMFELKAHREALINRINRRRRTLRFPVPEATYNGHAHIVSRIHERKLLHFNFIGSWVYPSPPPPRLRVHRRLDLQGKKFSFMDIAIDAREQFAAGMLVEGRGWFPRLSPADPFTEALVEMKGVWTELLEKIELKVQERRRVRVLIEDSRHQIVHKKEMDLAIRTADFKKCMDMAIQDKCSIDFETDDGLTALIVAAEENIGGLHHDYIRNDDDDPVLAVSYLLDRPTHAPAVNIETKFGNTALLHACALGREHVVEALLNRHAELHRQNKFGQAAVHVAAANGSARCMRLLLDRGADSDMKDNQGRTPYDLAIEQGFTDVLTIIGQIKGGYLGPVTVDRGAIDETINCPMGCGKFMNRYDVPDHLPVCLLRTVPCPLDCDDPHIIAREVDAHVSNDCPHRPMECDKCHQIYRTCDDQKHQNKLCPHRLLLCNLGCDSWVPAFEMVQHQKTCLYKIMDCPEQCGESYPIVKRLEHTRKHCINRRVVCPLKCTALVVFHTLSHHTSLVCPRRPMTCKWCGDPSVEYRHWNKHELTCSHRLVPCTKHCGEMIAERDMSHHLIENCRHRFVPCPLKCGYKARVVDMQTHVDTECENRMVDCSLGCTSVVSGVAAVTTRMLAKQMPIHLKTDCPERMIHCGACGLPMKAKEVEPHMRSSCEMRLVGCRLGGCAKKLPFKDREKHETFDCKYRLAFCPMGCGLRLVSYKMLRHQEGTCEMRRVECPLGCGIVLRQNVLTSHVESECPKRAVNYGGTKQRKPSAVPAYRKKELAAMALGGMGADSPPRSEFPGGRRGRSESPSARPTSREEEARNVMVSASTTSLPPI